MMKEAHLKHILIIGMAGALANLTAQLLLKKYPSLSITGIDQRPLPDHLSLHQNITYKKIHYSRGNFERLFRDNQFDAIYHLGRLGHVNNSLLSALEDHLDLNLVETKRVLDLALKYDVKKIIILSTYHVYGALHDNATFLLESNPLRASIKYPELRDVVEMDQIAENWLWKNRKKSQAVILRPSTIIGPQIKNTMTRYMLTAHAPVCSDFNPMYQFIYQDDMATILVRTLLEVPSGIYNVAPDECISLKEAKKVLKLSTTSAPSFLLKLSNRIAQSMAWSFPNYFIDYLKYSCIIDNTAIKEHLGNDLFRYKTKEALSLSKQT